MKQVQTALTHFLLKQTRFYIKDQEIQLSPQAKVRILKSVYQKIKAEIRQELSANHHNH